MPVLEHVDNVLVLEDDYLIALDLTDLLSRLGCARTQLACSPDEALSQVDGVAFATIDVKLGTRRCLPVVQKLEQLGIPFIYVSGYTEPDQPDLPKAPWVNKPATAEDLLAAILAALPPPDISGLETILDGHRAAEQLSPFLVASSDE